MPSFQTVVTPAHQRLAADIVGVLANQYPAADALIVLVTAVVLAARRTDNAREMVDNARGIIAQMHPERGPISIAVLEALADHMEPDHG